MPQPRLTPTAAEMRILRVLWANSGPSRLSEIQRALVGEGNPARTTIATTLKIMEGKGFVSRTKLVARGAWKARLTEKRAAKALVRGFLQRAFSGSAGDLMVHLIEHEKINNEDLKTIRALLDQVE